MSPYFYVCWLLIIVVLSSSKPSFEVVSSANKLFVLCCVGYNKFKIFSYIYFYLFYLILISVDPNCNPLHFCLCYFCFQVSCWSITQVDFRSCCAKIHYLPALEPSVMILCCAFIDAPAMVCVSSQLTLGICVIFLLLGWNCHMLWSTSYPHEWQYKWLLFSFMVL